MPSRPERLNSPQKLLQPGSTGSPTISISRQEVPSSGDAFVTVGVADGAGVPVGSTAVGDSASVAVGVAVAVLVGGASSPPGRQAASSSIGMASNTRARTGHLSTAQRVSTLYTSARGKQCRREQCDCDRKQCLATRKQGTLRACGINS